MRNIRTISDLIEALESFRRHHGDDAPVGILDGEYITQINKSDEVSDESHDFWQLVEKPTLLLW